jgi:TrmH family RNA methyltransferase
VSSARRLLKPGPRRSERRFLVEGPQAVGAAAAAGLLLEVFATAGAAERVAVLNVPVTIVGDRALATLTETVTPQGVVGVAASLDVPLDQALAGEPRLVVVLLDARDPGNAGTIIRTADAAGADAVILADGEEGGSVDVHNGKCVRASAGSVFHLPIAAAPWAEALDAIRVTGLRTLATTGTGDEPLDQLAGLERPTAWVLGNEAHGLPASVVAACDAAVRIPIRGRAESLNVASAAAVCLYASATAQTRR